MRTSTPEIDTDTQQQGAGPHGADTVSALTEGDFHLEAASVEAAVADVRKRTGRDPEVLGVEQVTRGGVGGFFAKELVRVHVRIGPVGAAVATMPPVEREHVTEARPRGVDGVLHALANVHDERERGFDQQLRKALAEARPVRVADVQEPPPTSPRPVESSKLAMDEMVGDVVDDLFSQHPDLEPAPRPEHDEPVVAPTPEEAATKPITSGSLRLMSPDVVERLSRPPVSVPTPSSAPDLQEQDEVVDGELVDASPEAPAAELEPVAPRVTAPVAPAANEVAPVIPAPGELRSGSPLASARALRPGTRWSPEGLYATGIPGAVIDRLDVGRGADEFTWMRAVAEAVAPWCRALPTGSSVLAGPRAGALGAALGLPVCDRNDRVPYGGDVALVATDGATSRAWMDDVRGDRWLHLVLGGRRWEGLVAAAPKAVSVVGRNKVTEALALCASFDLVLGHLLRDTSHDVAWRLTPLDVALAIREELPRAEGA